LYDFLEAIRNRVLIKFRHQKFWESEITDREVKPLALKEFNSRWYIIAEDTRDSKIKSFGLDRISDPEITKIGVKDLKDFNVNEHYKHSFGIIGSNGRKPEEIIISFNALQSKYIKTRKLHHSQEIVSETEEGLTIRLYLIITYDFVMELMSMAENLKVIKPQSLRHTLKSKAQKIVDQYS